eukprot:scaffold179_cov368-Prasinococcus_capsulatus_cf.AAC.31
MPGRTAGRGSPDGGGRPVNGIELRAPSPRGSERLPYRREGPIFCRSCSEGEGGRWGTCVHGPPPAPGADAESQLGLWRGAAWR